MISSITSLIIKLRLYVEREVPLCRLLDGRSIRYHRLRHLTKVNTSHRSVLTLRCQFLEFAARYQSQFNALEVLWVSDINNLTIKNIPYKQTFHKLGQESDLVVFDANEALNVNALGAICGCIRGGGALILLLPQDDKSFDNSRFYQRLLRIFSEYNIPVHSLESCPPISLTKSLAKQTNTLRPDNEASRFTATPDQEQAINAIKKVLTGHRNRPLVITSDRGRGKSTAIGMAVNQILLKRLIKVIVCAPAKAMVKPLIECAGKHAELHYMAPDELVRELPEAGLVVIDEAGAIPVPLLSKLLSHYSRLVFSTTLHGYEGNGRGFAIRFHEKLNQLTPEWRALKLNTPIRWNENDPLEALINDLLLLDECAHFSPLEQAEKVSDALTKWYLSLSSFANASTKQH